MNIWEKRDDENAKQYQAFCDYRDMGISRSLRGLIAQYHNQITTKPPSKEYKTIAGWSSKFGWQKRIEAWTIYQDETKRAKDEAARDKLRDEIIASEKADYEMLRQQWLERAEYIKPVDVKTELEDGRMVVTLKTKPYEFKAHIEARKRISEGLRLVAEMPNNIERNEQTGKDGAPVKFEWVDPFSPNDEIGIGADELPDTDND